MELEHPLRRLRALRIHDGDNSKGVQSALVCLPYPGAGLEVALEHSRPEAVDRGRFRVSTQCGQLLIVLTLFLAPLLAGVDFIDCGRRGSGQQRSTTIEDRLIFLVPLYVSSQKTSEPASEPQINCSPFAPARAVPCGTGVGIGRAGLRRRVRPG